jgi:hypothetical protein
MNCMDIKALLSALIDDELDAPRRHEAERHLAECSSCRDLLSHAERIDALIAADGEALAAEDAISPGFEAAVLDRTVFARDRSAFSRRWTTWGGWLAAAACLGLAMTIWLVDQRTMRARLAGVEGGDARGAGGAAPVVASASLVSQSWTFDEAQPAENFTRLAVNHRDRGDRFDAVGERAPRAALSLDDAETLYAAAILLEGLAQVNPQDAAGLEHLRQVAAFDELPRRLTALRGRVERADRPAVHAVQWVISQLADAPLDAGALDNLIRTINELELRSAIGRVIGDRWSLERSL